MPQQVVFEDEDQTILEYFSGFHNITYEAARNQLARVLFFKDDVNKKIRFLSGGEKSRFMILDEPTNHLDIDSREVLEETLSAFEGTLLFVSHDRYFINKVAGKIMTFENNRLITYPGDYTYYQEELQKAGKCEDLSNDKTRALSNEKKPPIGTVVNQCSRTENRSRKLNTNMEKELNCVYDKWENCQ